MSIEIKFHYIPVNSYTGTWQPAHQTASRHYGEQYGYPCLVEVNAEQFYAAIGAGDIVSQAVTDKEGQVFSRFSVRNRADGSGIGRVYGSGADAVYLLEVNFADRHLGVLTQLSEQAQLDADVRNGRRPRGG